MRSRRRTRWVIAVVAITAVAVALRYGPLYRSPLPFNPDGVIAARLAEDTVGNGRFPLARMAVDDLGFVGFLAIVGAVTGLDVLYVAQPVSGLVGAGPVLLVIPITARLARTHGWSPRRVRSASLLAGGLLAVEGLYLHRSMPTDEQTLGLLLVPVAVIAVWRAVRRGRRRWAYVAIPVLLVLPPVHNLDSVVLGLALTVLVVLGATAATSRRAVAGLFIACGLFWLYTFGYFHAVEALTPATIIQADRLTAIPGLFLAWIVLAALAARWFATLRTRAQRSLLLAVFGFMFLTVFVNAVEPVFPGTPTTAWLLLLLLAPLVLIAWLAAWATPLASRLDTDGPVVLGLAASPLALVGVSLTAALTPEYLATAYRAQTFLHFSVVILAGLGTVYVLDGPLPAKRPTLRAVTVALVLFSAAASIPVAFAGLELLPYKGVTTPAELGAAGFGATYAAGPWAADDHIARISPYHQANTEARRGPAYTWLAGGPAPYCLLVSQRSWTTSGAQFYPEPPVAIAPTTYRALLERRHVVYGAASRDPLAGSLPVRPRPGSC